MMGDKLTATFRIDRGFCAKYDRMECRVRMPMISADVSPKITPEEIERMKQQMLDKANAVLLRDFNERAADFAHQIIKLSGTGLPLCDNFVRLMFELIDKLRETIPQAVLDEPKRSEPHPIE